MTDTAEFPYRLAVGWVSKATLEGSDTYLLSAWSPVADQPSVLMFPWSPPADDITTFPQYTRYGQYSDQTQWADGPVNFDWGFKYFTELMQYYWEYTKIFTNATIQQAAVTVKTRRSAGEGTFGVWQCYANRAKPNKDFKRGVRGVDDYIQHFVGGVEITS